ncbi:type II toxin-antitoxin system MqsA family antitoxin [Paenisporosarcina quisquiliarum]|uniref:Type II toxin-antitoxin system MqsA family antitoxin n=1 Tax=Paenisporosarcina quisquiliarum TaxID=365346 RepID=A0A9X3RD73_9BACL|nr:type II toxin-antitoxin system MqsA family antitoxin [Paenisporosarcina quisquiliarum]MCZ8537271.1 type II toxin-antitoxin system MqsA family antitoxin [Paenisporosarcina quisquiliarum]
MNNNDLFNDIMKGLKQAEAYSKGDEKAARVKKYKITAINDYNEDTIKKIRSTLHLSQRAFAEVMGVSTKTIEAWERGINKPSGSSSRLLQIFEENPSALKEYHLVESSSID